MITFSIIIPVYNVELYLREAIASVCSQSFSDFELILVDDGSSDNSLAIIQELANIEARIQILQTNRGGAGAARNAGLKLARGKFIYFMDSDDYIECNTLKKIHKCFENGGIDLVAFTATPFADEEYTNAHSIDIVGSAYFYQRPFLAEGMYSGTAFYEVMSMHNNFVASVCLYAVKKDLITQKNLSFSEGVMMEDELFSRQIFLACKDVFFLQERLYQRRIRPGSVSTGTPQSMRIKSLINVAEALQILEVDTGRQMLKCDSEKFYQWAVEALNALPLKNEDYEHVASLVLSSPLAASYLPHDASRHQLNTGTSSFIKKAVRAIKKVIKGT